ncbi:proton-coupled folate transporter-like isoform X1 [Leptidea sinapis]|uniref:proton-coupled folate transporter-like isoform X1 n=2 Tax=Leptidea sinapis TaxID=189913 RepID=UPI00213F0177|nr:proton-coupled folate transporter-like isoform X1 [Leptidea sinapis]
MRSVKYQLLPPLPHNSQKETECTRIARYEKATPDELYEVMNSEDLKKPGEEEEPLDDRKKAKHTHQDEDFFFEKLKRIKSNITVEPILAGLVIPSMLARLAIQNLNLDKACRVKCGFDDEICDALLLKRGNLTFYEAEVQKVISSIEAWKSVVQTSLPTILVIFMGAWSDRTGNRKICILLPICGELCVCVTNILSTYFFHEISVEVTMFLEAFFPAITGGWVLVYLGVFSYISDVTTQETRTFRVGLVNLCMTAGIPVGTALSGILLSLWGYYGIFLISAVIYLITITYGCIYIEKNTKPGNKISEKQKPFKFVEVFSLVKETVAVTYKKRERNLRTKIILTLSVVAIIYGPNHGERIITYMFVRYRLKWDALKFSLYSTYSIITHSLGALFSISIFSKRWGYHDSTLALISITSKLIGSVYIAFVRTDFEMFMVPIVEILNATTFTSLRSMASKLVRDEEMGKMNSLFSLVETLAALLFDPTYSTLYSRTISIFTGAVYIFSAIMTIPAISILLWLFVQHRSEAKQKRIEDGEK